MKPSEFFHLNIRGILTACLFMAATAIGAQNSIYYLKDGRTLNSVKSVTRDQRNFIFRYDGSDISDTIAVSGVSLIKTSLEGWTNISEGLDDLLCMSDGQKYQGRVIRQMPGISFTLKLKRDNSIVELPANQLVCAKKVRRNHDKDYWEQRSYDNVVETQYATYRGIIIEQNLGEDVSNPDDDFIVIFTEDYRIKKTIMMSDIQRFTIEYH